MTITNPHISRNWGAFQTKFANQNPPTIHPSPVSSSTITVKSPAFPNDGANFSATNCFAMAPTGFFQQLSIFIGCWSLPIVDAIVNTLSSYSWLRWSWKLELVALSFYSSGNFGRKTSFPQRPGLKFWSTCRNTFVGPQYVALRPCTREEHTVSTVGIGPTIKKKHVYNIQWCIKTKTPQLVKLSPQSFMFTPNKHGHFMPFHAISVTGGPSSNEPQPVRKPDIFADSSGLVMQNCSTFSNLGDGWSQSATWFKTWSDNPWNCVLKFVFPHVF